MGNEISGEEQNLEEGSPAMSMNLDNPDVDKRVNAGTTAANCQPKHTQESLMQENAHNDNREDSGGTGLEIVHSGDGKNQLHLPDDGSSAPLSPDKRRLKKNNNAAGTSANSSKDGSKSVRDASGGRRNRRQSSAEMEREEPKKLGYIQMARLGYQELVNAIIRPPRADYKVCLIIKYRIVVA